jgi:hypothetical protein
LSATAIQGFVQRLVRASTKPGHLRPTRESVNNASRRISEEFEAGFGPGKLSLGSVLVLTTAARQGWRSSTGFRPLFRFAGQFPALIIFGHLASFGSADLLSSSRRHASAC